MKRHSIVLGIAVVGLLLFSTVGVETAFFPTVFFACFAIGLGLGMAFMPLLTLAIAVLGLDWAIDSCERAFGAPGAQREVVERAGAA